MKTTLIAAGVMAAALAAPAAAVTVSPRAAGIHDGTSAIQKVDRRRVCEMRRGERHCWWVGRRDWDDRRWDRWHRDNWRSGWFWDGPGVSVRVR